MKKITFLLLACSMAILSFAAGGNITYELNGGVTNDYGWKNKADMLVGLNADYNSHYGVETSATWYTWETLDKILASGDPVTLIPTYATKMWGVISTDKWQWLHDYIKATVASQGLGDLAEAENAYWRYNTSAFFISGQRATWPKSADFAVAGQPSAFIPAWKHAFAGPNSYDGSEEVIIPAPYKEGFTFDGWYETADFSGDRVTSIPAGAEGDKTLYAKWIEYVPTIKEVWGKGTGGVETKAAGAVTYIDGNMIYIQDATAGLLVEFSAVTDVAVGNKVTVSGTTGEANGKIKLTNATLVSKTADVMPDAQTVSLATLLSDIDAYLYEYVNILGLGITGYDANGYASLSDDVSIVKTKLAFNQGEFPVGTKVDAKVVVGYDDEIMLVGDVANIEKSPLAGVDPFNYPSRGDGKYNLTSKWLVSSNMDNLSSNPIGKGGYVRGMTVKDGKMYFIDRDLKQLTVVDGNTGQRLKPIKLADDIFTYVNEEGETKTAGTLPFNDIKLDNAGNVLIANCITSNKGVFQVWKVDLETGKGKLIFQEILANNPDYEEATVRFDAFGVYGDIDGDATILAANASALEVYRWDIVDGELAEPGYAIILTTEGNNLEGKTNPGSAPQVFPIDDNLFYLDGNETLPTLFDADGNFIDGFENNMGILKDSLTNAPEMFKMNQGHNGLVEFQIGDEHFFLIAAANTVGAPPSSFRLFKWKDANKLFADMESLWTFPAAGMGAISNPYRTAIPMVEVDEASKSAKIYLYAGENGYGMYEFTTTSTGIFTNEISNVTFSLKDNKIIISEEVALAEVYSLTGQRLVSAKNTAAIYAPANKGAYIVNIVDKEGARLTQKIIVY